MSEAEKRLRAFIAERVYSADAERENNALLDAALAAARNAALEEARAIAVDEAKAWGDVAPRTTATTVAGRIQALQSAPAQVVPFEVADEWRQEMERLRAIVQGQRTGAILVSAADEVVSKAELREQARKMLTSRAFKASPGEEVRAMLGRLGVDLDATMETDAKPERAALCECGCQRRVHSLRGRLCRLRIHSLCRVSRIDAVTDVLGL